ARQIWGLKAPVAEFSGQQHQETGWAPDALSPAGAQGMAQIMTATAKWESQVYPELHENKPLQPAWAIRALEQNDRQLSPSKSAK
ncbi:transglycosylase SLT domain-containing protein, partial [Salmonella enterica subsp. enterica serovar Infantis]